MSLKKELPQNMHSLCSESGKFSGSNLFGNDLSADIKEVSELNKISQQLRGNNRFFRGRGRGLRGSVRGYRSFTPRFRGGRIIKRYVPRRGAPASRKAPLNKYGPSRS